MTPIFSSHKHLPLGIVIGLLIAVAFSLLAFSEPTQAPPGGNVAAPVNVSGTAQTKSGKLNIGGGLSYWITKIGDSFALENNAGETKFIIGQNGNVGIGNTNPSQKLDVAGQIHATGDICTDVGGKCISAIDGNKFGGLYTTTSCSGCGCPATSCNNSNPYTGGCSCPSFASSAASVISEGTCGGDMWCYRCTTQTTYQCYK